tara:strand:+ start:777 stop:1313 length:537 start_codon:yes stop_codon:yes gene_type:complete
MKYTLAKKAYEIDFSKIEEGFLYDSFMTYAETRNKAKSQLLKRAYCENVCLSGEDEEVTYLTIPVIRCKQADKFHFEGAELSLYDIDQLKFEKKRNKSLDDILNDNGIKYCYIRKGSYYKPNSCGYTDFKHRAGVYSKEEAVSSAKSCRDITLEIIDIQSHNEMLNIEIAELQNKLLA